MHCDSKGKDVLWYYRTTTVSNTFLLTCSGDSEDCKDCLISKEYKAMTEYPREKYQYYTDNKRKVVAVSSFAGQTVRGVATCSDRDTFDIEKGKKLAAARCAAKVARKRFKRAQKKFDEACDMQNKADLFYDKMCQYYNDALYDLENWDSVVKEMTNEF